MIPSTIRKPGGPEKQARDYVFGNQMVQKHFKNPKWSSEVFCF